MVAEELGEDMSVVLPAVHALSGCDSTSAFSNIGKGRWMQMASYHPELMSGLKLLGSNGNEVQEESQRDCISLVSLLYCGKPVNNLNEIRYELSQSQSQCSFISISNEQY